MDSTGPATPRAPNQRSVQSLLLFRIARGKAGADFIRQLLDLIFGWHARIHDRRHLTGLNDHLLHDIGISRAEIEHEPSRPFWRVDR